MQLKYIASNRVLAGPINTSIQGIKAKKNCSLVIIILFLFGFSVGNFMLVVRKNCLFFTFLVC